MVNIDSSGLRDDERKFVEDFASLLAPWGLPISQGRIYGYVLMNAAPVSLDQIAADLEMSKGGAWNAAKLLERFGHIRRYGETGTKRVFYGPSDNYAAILLAQSALLGDVGKLLQGCATNVAAAGAVDRLTRMADFHLSMRRSMDAAIHELTTDRPGEPS